MRKYKSRGGASLKVHELNLLLPRRVILYISAYASFLSVAGGHDHDKANARANLASASLFMWFIAQS
jgi:hypothetical protein